MDSIYLTYGLLTPSIRHMTMTFCFENVAPEAQIVPHFPACNTSTRPEFTDGPSTRRIGVAEIQVLYFVNGNKNSGTSKSFWSKQCFLKPSKLHSKH